MSCHGVGEQEGQRHHVELRIDRIGDAAETDVDRARAHPVSNRRFVTKLAVGEDLYGNLPASLSLYALGEAGDRLLDEAAGTGGVSKPQRVGMRR